MNLNSIMALDPLMWYKANEDILTNSGFLWDILRDIGWALVKFLALICQACEVFLTKAYDSVDFVASSGIGEMIEKWKGVYVVFLAISILIFGLTKIINPENKNTKILGNVFLFIGVTCMLSVGMVECNKLMKDGIAVSNSVNTSGSATASSPILGTINSNVISVKRCYANYWKKDELYINKGDSNIKGINGLPADDILLLDPTTVYVPDSSNAYLIDRAFDSGTGGMDIEISNDTSLFGIGDPEYYYMYSIDYLSIFIYLIAMIMAYLFSAYKVIRIIYELAIHKILAFIHAPLDLNNGQKIKKILIGIVNSYVVLIAISLFIQIFNIYNNYLNSRQDLTSLEKSLFILFGAFVLIDGPNLIEQLYGIDAGLSSGYKMIRGLTEAVRGAKDIGSGAMGLAGAAKTAATSAAGGISGAAAGTAGAIKDSIRGKSSASEGGANSLSKMKSEDSSSSPSQAARNRNQQNSSSESRNSSLSNSRNQQNSSSENRNSSSSNDRSQQNSSSESRNSSSSNDRSQQNSSSENRNNSSSNDRNQQNSSSENRNNSSFDDRNQNNIPETSNNSLSDDKHQNQNDSYDNRQNGSDSKQESDPWDNKQESDSYEPKRDDRSMFDMYDEDLHKNNQNDYNQTFDSVPRNSGDKSAEGNNFRDLVNSPSSRDEFKQNYANESMSDYIKNRRQERSVNPSTNAGKHFEGKYRSSYRATNAVINTVKSFKKGKK